ncbi:MAG: type II toxin-antitoxin system Phd/YefM family antitoxin [Candidatus Dormibacteria bacterium]
MLRVGVRELRQRASAIIRVVEQGGTVEVTNHGRPVLRMVPIPPGQGALERLLAEGRATQARGDLLKIPGPPLGPGRTPLSQVLAQLRQDER